MDHHFLKYNFISVYNVVKYLLYLKILLFSLDRNILYDYIIEIVNLARVEALAENFHLFLIPLHTFSFLIHHALKPAAIISIA